MKKNVAQTVAMGGIIAALYVVLTLIANAFGLANYAIQVRFSEALTILPYFTQVAVPGLFVGCIISNILTGAMPLDVVFGSIATLLGALGTRALAVKFPEKKWLAPIPPIVSNTIIVPLILAFVYQFEGSIPYFMLTVGIGEIISCEVLGMLLFKTIEKYKGQIFKSKNQ